MKRTITSKRLTMHGMMKCAIYLIFSFFIMTNADYVFALKNPAAVYCKALGYEYMRFYEEKGTRGACKLPGNPVDAWGFLKGKTGQDYSYCVQEGYEIKTVLDSERCNSIYSEECAVCLLTDGTEVEVTVLMNLSFAESTCGDGTCGDPENFASCPEDCSSGGFDSYCDGLADGLCDPDCAANQDTDCTVIADRDGDGIQDAVDNCPDTPNPDQTDTDSDGSGDQCDSCMNDPEKVNPGICGCGVPDVDSDSDGVADCIDACPVDPDKTIPGVCGCGVSDIDADADGIADCNDNCPAISNPDQTDSDGDGMGDACEVSCSVNQTPGDLDADCDVDFDDRAILWASLRQCAGDSGFNPEADYDNDGCITFNDYRIWYGNYKAAR